MKKQTRTMIVLVVFLVITLPGVLAFDTYINNTNIFVNGSVGIGTNIPNASLHVVGSVYLGSEGNGLIVDADSNKRIGFMKYTGREAGIWRISNQDFEIGRVGNVTALPGSPTNWTTDLYISGTGNVGIGTTSPSQTLHVNGTFAVRNKTGILGLFQSVLGKVGIRTSSPNSTLEVNGTFSVIPGTFDSGNGVVSRAGNDVIVAYTTAGTTAFSPPEGVASVRVLVVAGGGGGGHGEAAGGGDGSGGGGAGGYIHNTSYAVTAGTSYTVTVGAGGAGATAINNDGTDGGDSVFGALTADGGGGGGADNNNGRNGGSGGGAGGACNADTSPGTGTAGQGNNGGDDGDADCSDLRSGGGGGGAGAVGGDATTARGGNGGNGASNDITGTSVTYAAGGGGGGGNDDGPGAGGSSGVGGIGGNATGTETDGGDGRAGTGSGGGGGAASTSGTDGGDGADGAVIVRFTLASSTTNVGSGLVVDETGGLNFIRTNCPSGWWSAAYGRVCMEQTERADATMHTAIGICKGVGNGARVCTHSDFQQICGTGQDPFTASDNWFGDMSDTDNWFRLSNANACSNDIDAGHDNGASATHPYHCCI